MQTFLNYLLSMVTVVLVIPVTVLLVEVVACVVRPFRDDGRTEELYPRVAVLVPAHNESAGLLSTVGDIRAQLRPGDRLLVVADNCTDDTAAVAEKAGAEVIERFDRSKVGKGYALDFGIRHLKLDAPDILIVIDADCRLAEGTVASLSRACQRTGRPAQALDLMTAAGQSEPHFRVAEFAWRVKNWVRPLGLKNLSLPCQLMGTGMAFPWAVIGKVNIASGRIVEDLNLGLDLAAIGHPAIFCPSALVTSRFPETGAGANAQRQRWEQGHIHTILAVAPRFLVRALLNGDKHLLALTLDLAVPPLSLLGLLMAGLIGLTIVFAYLGFSILPLIVMTIANAAFILAVLLSWWQFGRDLLPLSGAHFAVPYVLGKVRVYTNLALGRGVSQWTRADRKKVSEDTRDQP